MPPHIMRVVNRKGVCHFPFHIFRHLVPQPVLLMVYCQKFTVTKAVVKDSLLSLQEHL